VREQTAVLEHEAESPPPRRLVDTGTMRPCRGRSRPAVACSTVVLPAPLRPISAVMPRGGTSIAAAMLAAPRDTSTSI
jgi:hypothetical protein